MGASSSAPQIPPGYFPQGAAAYVPTLPGAVSTMSTTSSVMLGLFVGFLVIIVVVAALRATAPATTIDQAPVPISGKTGGTIPATGIPLNPGSDYALQFWMFVQDWDYRFGQEKEVLMRTATADSTWKVLVRTRSKWARIPLPALVQHHLLRKLRKPRKKMMERFYPSVSRVVT